MRGRVLVRHELFKPERDVPLEHFPVNDQIDVFIILS